MQLELTDKQLKWLAEVFHVMDKNPSLICLDCDDDSDRDWVMEMHEKLETLVEEIKKKEIGKK